MSEQSEKEEKPSAKFNGPASSLLGPSRVLRALVLLLELSSWSMPASISRVWVPLGGVAGHTNP